MLVVLTETYRNEVNVPRTLWDDFIQIQFCGFFLECDCM